MFHYVYILESENDKSLYIGYSPRLKDRLIEHNQGKSKSTKSKVPWKLIYYEAYLDKTDALGREKYLKTGYGRRSLSKMLKNYYNY